LLIGETGTGKDLAAQAIHQQSARSEGPYIPVNLGAIPAGLVASELFGHERGAFTGAAEQRKGIFERAHDGTVFLDEIGTIDEKVQVSLLRLIEQKKFHRLGGRRGISSNVRLIAASNQDLVDAVQQGIFREDLYYRLDVFRIMMPPLQERQEDISLLIDEFLKRYNRKFQKNILGISPESVSLLESYDWPGNVRELKNVIQRGVLVCSGEVLLPEHLPPRFRADRVVRPKVTFTVGTPLEEVEREMVIRALAVAKNNRTRAADLLGISRRALYNKLHKHRIR
jgi:transcriptional regulator with PAS, ATPase and Fis domain